MHASRTKRHSSYFLKGSTELTKNSKLSSVHRIHAQRGSTRLSQGLKQHTVSLIRKNATLAASSQKDNKNRKKQVFFLLEGNSQKSLQEKGKTKNIEDISCPARFNRNFKNLKTRGTIFFSLF
jgi:hypothetical protein